MSLEFIAEQFMQPAAHGASYRYGPPAAYLSTNQFYPSRSTAGEFFSQHLVATRENMVRIHPADDSENPPHIQRRQYFDKLHAENWIKRNVVSAKPRSAFKAGQVARVFYSSRRGSNTLPSGDFFYVQLLCKSPDYPSGAYWYVRVLFRPHQPYSQYYIGETHMVSHNALAGRLDFETLGADGETNRDAQKFLDLAAVLMTQQWGHLVYSTHRRQLQIKYPMIGQALRNAPEVPNHRGEPRRAAHWNSDVSGSFVGHTRTLWATGQVVKYAIPQLSALSADDADISAKVKGVIDACNEVVSMFCLHSNGRAIVSAYIRDFLRGKLELVDRAADGLSSCGHWHREHTEVSRAASLCGDCLAEALRNGTVTYVTRRDGTLAYVYSAEAYLHDDGKYYSYAPPKIVGSYHSSKAIHRNPLPLLTGKRLPSDALKLGFELEFDEHGSNCTTRENIALEMKRRLKPVFDAVAPVPYASWEEDCSVWFEMVSGYGDISVHREALRLMLEGNPFKGRLRSHDGGRCGLHVHLDCPKTLSHALKLTQFYNAACNEYLISTVARRTKNFRGEELGNGKYSGKKSWVRPIQQRTEYGGSLGDALQYLSSDRYQTVNWSNAPRSVEIRIFRGTMLAESAIACLEFAYLSWFFARDTPDDALTTQNFLAFISRNERRRDSKYLRAYLSKRGVKGVFLANTKPLDEDEQLVLEEVTDESDTEYVKKYNQRVQKRRARLAMQQAA